MRIVGLLIILCAVAGCARTLPQPLPRGDAGDRGATDGGDAGATDGGDAGGDAGSGISCDAGNECASGWCEQGVCCYGPCRGWCRTCDGTGAGARGYCSVAGVIQNPSGLRLTDARDAGGSAFSPSISADENHYVVSWSEALPAAGMHVYAQTIDQETGRPATGCLPAQVSVDSPEDLSRVSSVASRRNGEGEAALVYETAVADGGGVELRFVRIRHDAGASRSCVNVNSATYFASVASPGATASVAANRILWADGPDGGAYLGFAAFRQSASGPCRTDTLCYHTWPVAGGPSPPMALQNADLSSLNFSTAADRRNFADFNGAHIGLFYQADGGIYFNTIDPVTGRSTRASGPVFVETNATPLGISWNASAQSWDVPYHQISANLRLGQVYSNGSFSGGSGSGFYDDVVAAHTAAPTLTVDGGIAMTAWIGNAPGRQQFILGEIAQFQQPLRDFSAGEIVDVVDITYSPDKRRFGIVWSGRANSDAGSDIYFMGVTCQ